MVRSSIEEAHAFFLHSTRIAVVGVSRDPKEFSRYVFHALRGRGYDVVPVNPALAEVEGVPASARVSDIDPPPDAALLLVPAAKAAEVVRDCLRARVHRIWCHRGTGPGVATDEVLALCAANRLEAVHGLCPLMALPGASFPHRLHGALRRVLAHEAPHGHVCGLL